MAVTGAQSAVRVPLTTLIRRRGLARTEAVSVVGRLGFCLWSSTALLYMSSQFDVKVAGYAVALFTVSAAICAAPLCALFEAGARSFMISGVLVLNACSCALLITAGHRHPVMALVGIGLAGTSSPPTAAVMRSIWQRNSSSGEISRFQAMESMITQICVVVSPALVGIFSAGLLRAAAPIMASACACAGAGLMWIWSRPHIRVAKASETSAARRRPATVRLLGLFAVICGSAMVSGFFNISMAARFAGRTGFLDTPGTVIAAAAIGSIAGGLLFARLWRWPGTRWGYIALMSAWALALWLLATTNRGFLVLAIAFVSGLPVTGIGAEEFAALGRLVGSRSAWLFGLANMAISTGVGAGASAGAQLATFTDSGRLLPGTAATAILALSTVLWLGVAGLESRDAYAPGG